MRLHYGLFFQHKYEALDEAGRLLKALDPQFLTRFKAHFSDHDYVRELRNTIVHRGLDIVGHGTVLSGVVVPYCPVVANSSGRIEFRASCTTLLELAMLLEVSVNSAIWAGFQAHPDAFATPTMTADEAIDFAATIPHIPEEIRAFLPTAFAQIDMAAAQAAIKCTREKELCDLLGAASMSPPEEPHVRQNT